MVKFIGTDYGGWMVETTGIMDSIVYSFGIGKDISFDFGMIERYGCKVFGFDPSPESFEWANKKDKVDGFSILPYGISDIDGTAKYYKPQNKNFISGSLIYNEKYLKKIPIKVKVRKLKTIMEELNHKIIDILKLDIEGSEYKVINNIIKDKIFPKQILVEYHTKYLHWYNEICSSISLLEKYYTLINKKNKDYLWLLKVGNN